jgi:hypothetical protein
LRLIFALVCAVCWLPIAQAQGVRLYDRSRDEAAQKALEASKKVANGSIFEAELKNLDTFAKLEFDSTFAAEARVRSNMVSAIATGRVSVVGKLVNDLKEQLDTGQIRARIAGLETERDRLQEQLGKLQAEKPSARPPDPANPDGALADLVSQGIDVDQAAVAVAGSSKGTDAGRQAIELIGKALAASQTAANATAANGTTANDAAGQLQKLRASLSSLAVDRVRIELNDKKTLIKIWQRAADDVRQTQALIKEYESLAAGLDPQAMILDVIRSKAEAARAGPADVVRARRQELDDAVSLSFTASAIAARWNSAPLVAQLREAHEKHLYSIQRSRLEAHALEVAVGSGAQRLAIFYKGGIRPEILAQILYTAATASLSATIAATK